MCFCVSGFLLFTSCSASDHFVLPSYNSSVPGFLALAIFALSNSLLFVLFPGSLCLPLWRALHPHVQHCTNDWMRRFHHLCRYCKPTVFHHKLSHLSAFSDLRTTRQWGVDLPGCVVRPTRQSAQKQHFNLFQDLSSNITILLVRPTRPPDPSHIIIPCEPCCPVISITIFCRISQAKTGRCGGFLLQCWYIVDLC